MGWFIRKSVKAGPFRVNISKRGIGMSAGGKGFRVGTGPRGPYVAGGRGGIYFRQRLGKKPTSQAAQPRNASAGMKTSPTAITTEESFDSMQPNTSSAQTAFPRHLYSGRTLALLGGTFAAGIVLILSDPTTYSSASGTGATATSAGALGTIGAFICVCEVVAICVLDWRGATTLNGFIKWRGMRMWQRLVVGYFLIGLSIFLVPVYLIQAFSAYRHAKHMEPVLRQRQVAQLEADLGIMPPTEGVCRSCGKPLQVGAEFCAYCAAPVVAKPLICPVCATTALPDARFCPKCRSPLRADV